MLAELDDVARTENRVARREVVDERSPVVVVLPHEVRHEQHGGDRSRSVERRAGEEPRIGRQGEEQHQGAVVFAVSHQRDRRTHPEPCEAAALREVPERPQENRRRSQQRPVGHGDKAVELQQERRGRKHDEQRRIAPHGIRRTDEPPQRPEIERLQHGKEEPHAQLAAEKPLPEPHEQRRHGRMVEIAPCEPLGEHVVIGLVVGQLRAARLDQVGAPPHPEPQGNEPVGPERGERSFERLLHIGPQR